MENVKLKLVTTVKNDEALFKYSYYVVAGIFETPIWHIFNISEPKMGASG